MSLNWNISKCKDWEKLDENVTQTILFLMMPVGQPGISEKNVDLVWNRISLMQKLSGAFMSFIDENGDRKDYPVIREHLVERIGLTVNVAPISDAAFLKNVYRTHCERNARQARETAKKES